MELSEEVIKRDGRHTAARGTDSIGIVVPNEHNEVHVMQLVAWVYPIRYLNQLVHVVVGKKTLMSDPHDREVGQQCLVPWMVQAPIFKAWYIFFSWQSGG